MRWVWKRSHGLTESGIDDKVPIWIKSMEKCEDQKRTSRVESRGEIDMYCTYYMWQFMFNVDIYLGSTVAVEVLAAVVVWEKK